MVRRHGKRSERCELLAHVLSCSALTSPTIPISYLWSKRAPEHSIAGIVLACASLVVMPLLARAKRKVSHALGSAAMHADATGI
jgi:divalent metal cation (Fe/Co/Zn/Cd) transporter